MCSPWRGELRRLLFFSRDPDKQVLRLWIRMNLEVGILLTPQIFITRVLHSDAVYYHTYGYPMFGRGGRVRTGVFHLCKGI